MQFQICPGNLEEILRLRALTRPGRSYVEDRELCIQQWCQPVSTRSNRCCIAKAEHGGLAITTGDFFGISHSTVFQVTWRFIEALEAQALHHPPEMPSTNEEMEKVKSKFEKVCGLPNCCGAIDLTHIVMNLSTTDPYTGPWLDEQERSSMVLQAIVGPPKMRFQDIVTRWPRRMNEHMVFKTLYFNQLCENRELLGEQIELPDGTSISEYVVGDSGYPLLPRLITPYHSKEVSGSKLKFNRRHGKATESKDNWRIIKGVMWRLDRHKLSRVILACCLLHNIGIDMDNNAGNPNSTSSAHDPGYDQQLSCS